MEKKLGTSDACTVYVHAFLYVRHARRSRDTKICFDPKPGVSVAAADIWWRPGKDDERTGFSGRKKVGR